MSLFKNKIYNRKTTNINLIDVLLRNSRRGCCSLLWNMPGALHVQQSEPGLAPAYETTVRAVEFLSREFHI